MPTREGMEKVRSELMPTGWARSGKKGTHARTVDQVMFIRAAENKNSARSRALYQTVYTSGSVWASPAAIAGSEKPRASVKGRMTGNNMSWMPR